MNTEIMQFIAELREVVDESFVYKAEVWQFNHRSNQEVKYSIAGNMKGFSEIVKDTEEELIAAFPLIRKLVGQLMEAKETDKKIKIKLIASSYPL